MSSSSEDLALTQAQLDADDAYNDDEDYVDGEVKSSPKASKAGKDLDEFAAKADVGVRAALDKVLTVAQRMSDFYAASESFSGDGGKRAPTAFTGDLYDYQKRGVDWLVKLHDNGTSGILADEMGLGKTVQVIAFICHMLQHGSGPALIVAPLAVLSNWVREFHRFAPSVPICRYYGSQEERAELRATQLSPRDGNLRKLPVVITTFQIAMNDRKFLAPLQWSFLCVDEGHRMKSVASRLKQELTHYTSHEDGKNGIVVTRLLLTGTPLQNNLAELWSLCNFVLPQVFESLSMFQRWFNFDRLNELEGQEAVVEQQRNGQIVSKLHAILSPFLLRRVKEEVVREDPRLSLPPKVECIVFVGMSKDQTRLYEAVAAGRIKDEIDAMKWTSDGTEDPRATNSELKTTRLSNRMMQARKVCCHPYLFGEPIRRKDEEHTDERIVTSCGKLQALDKMLKQLKAAGHRVLIFSQFVRVLEILDDYFKLREREFGEDAVRVYHGGLSPEEKDAAVSDFQAPGSDVFAFLVSTRAGGLGMNLTGADTVIIYDGDWNPHGDSQAQDRAHRFGQDKPVVVYRLVTAASVEVHVVKTADAKRSLEKIVLLKKSSSSGPKTPKPAPAEDSSLKRRRRDPALPAPSPVVSPLAGDDADDDIEEETLRALLRPEFDHEKVGGHCIDDAELALVLNRPVAMATGQKARAEAEALLPTSSPVPAASAADGASPAPSPLQRRNSKTPFASPSASPSPSPSPSGSKKRSRAAAGGAGSSTPLPAATSDDDVRTIPTCGRGYQFVYRKTTSLVGSVSMEGQA